MAKQSSKLLEHARASEAETNQKLAEVRAARERALLKSDDTNAILTFDQEITELTRVSIAKADRVKILEREAEQEEVEQRAKRHAQLIDRIEAEFKRWVENGEEIEKAVNALLKLYRRQIELGGKIAVAWRWDNSDLMALRLHGVGIKELIAHEFYRTSFMGGSGAVGPHAVSLPGSICPRPLEWRLTPEKIKPFADTLRQLAEYGSKKMRGGKGAVPRTRPALTAAETKLSELLIRQAALANDVSLSGEEKYRAIVAEISALSLEIATAETVGKPAKPNTPQIA